MSSRRRPHLGIIEYTAYKAFGVEGGVVGVHRDLILRGIVD